MSHKDKGLITPYKDRSLATSYKDRGVACTSEVNAKRKCSVAWNVKHFLVVGTTSAKDSESILPFFVKPVSLLFG